MLCVLCHTRAEQARKQKQNAIICARIKRRFEHKQGARNFQQQLEMKHKK